MRILPSPRYQPDIREISLRLPSVLHEAGSLCSSEQASRCIDAGCHCQIQGRTWAGAHLGVRAPDLDETPLSIDECWIAVREGLI